MSKRNVSTNFSSSPPPLHSAVPHGWTRYFNVISQIGFRSSRVGCCAVKEKSRISHLFNSKREEGDHFPKVAQKRNESFPLSIHTLNLYHQMGMKG